MIHDCSLGWAYPGISSSASEVAIFSGFPPEWVQTSNAEGKSLCAAPNSGSLEQLPTIMEEIGLKRCRRNFAHVACADIYWLSHYRWICSLLKKCNAWQGLPSIAIWRTKNRSFLFFFSAYSVLYAEILYYRYFEERRRGAGRRNCQYPGTINCCQLCSGNSV